MRHPGGSKRAVGHMEVVRPVQSMRTLSQSPLPGHLLAVAQLVYCECAIEIYLIKSNNYEVNYLLSLKYVLK